MAGPSLPLRDTSFTLLGGGLHRCTPAWDKPADGIDQCFKLYFVVSGQGRLTLKSESATLDRGMAYFIPGYQLVSQACADRMDVYWLHFTPDSLYMSYLMAHVARTHAWPLRKLPGWRPTYLAIPRLFDAPLAWLQYRVQAMILDLVSRTLEPYNFRHMAAVDPVFDQLQPAIAYMDEHLLDNPTLSEIARAVHLTPNYFHRRFTETFHVTPLVYMLQRRLNMARQLLLGTKLTLQQVASRSGFSSAFYLSRTFKKHYRLSPRQFRTRAEP